MAETTGVTMTVSGLAPLRVIADAADTAAPAEAVVDGTSYAVGDRVSVTIRNPRVPLVTGKVTS